MKKSANGIKIIEVLNSRKKIVICPGFGCTPDILNETISMGYDEITLQNVNIEYIQRESISKKYEGSPRKTLEKHLYGIGWRQWKFDNFIWLAPEHNCFSEKTEAPPEVMK